MARLNILRTAMLGLAALMIAGLAATAGWASDADEIRFRVLLNDKEIGYHSFRVVDRGGEQIIESEASFDVKLLFVPVYSYRHSNTEVWRDGCLSAIDSRTDDNGEALEVHGTPKDGGIEIATREDTDVIPGCVMTFAYWNPDFLRQSRLLNAQNGEYMTVQIEAAGPNVLSVGERSVVADTYRILAADKGVDITVWYDRGTRQWLGLESVAKNGQLIRYLPDNAEALATAGRKTFTNS